jgi:hypothetical protein
MSMYCITRFGLSDHVGQILILENWQSEHSKYCSYIWNVTDLRWYNTKFSVGSRKWKVWEDIQTKQYK